jgi:hypothetical protein
MQLRGFDAEKAGRGDTDLRGSALRSIAEGMQGTEKIRRLNPLENPLCERIRHKYDSHNQFLALT